MSICEKELRFGLVERISEILERAEVAEADLSYGEDDGSERNRKKSGSYYTPVDVARYFWDEFFRLRGLNDASTTRDFLCAHDFIEPAVGAGALFFALLEKLLRNGLDSSDISVIRASVFDINSRALDFVKKQIRIIEKAEGVKFKNIKYKNADFISSPKLRLSGHAMVFGNPPFVANKKYESRWKNKYADFLERALNMSGETGSVSFIVPFSIAFSRDYLGLRSKLVIENRLVALSSFDNIPDALFKFGKPKSVNTNKANSQRCTIVSSIPSCKRKVISTRLNRWARGERSKVLSAPSKYYDVTGFSFEGQIIRPANSMVSSYIKATYGRCLTIGDLVKEDGLYVLNVAAVARNYLGFREDSSSSVVALRFSRKSDFYRILSVIASDLFFDYWLTVGDGFHVTKSNIYKFPLHDAVLGGANEYIGAAKRMWELRKRYAKVKINAGLIAESYDFSGEVPSFYPLIKKIR